MKRLGHPWESRRATLDVARIALELGQFDSFRGASCCARRELRPGPAPEAALLQAVAVFAGAFQLEDASAFANLDPAEAAKLQEELAAPSLLSGCWRSFRNERPQPRP